MRVIKRYKPAVKRSISTREVRCIIPHMYRNIIHIIRPAALYTGKLLESKSSELLSQEKIIFSIFKFCIYMR